LIVTLTQRKRRSSEDAGVAQKAPTSIIAVIASIGSIAPQWLTAPNFAWPRDESMRLQHSQGEHLIQQQCQLPRVI